MAKLSICIIANNEEKIIEEGIKSILEIADEIIFVDTGCTDSTPEIMRKYTDKIYKYKWINDFGDAYNFSHSKANFDYAMAWNADYIIDSKSLELLKQAKARDFDGANMVNLNWTTETNEEGQPLIWVNKAFITKPKEIQYKYPDHTKAVARAGFKEHPQTYQNISIGERSLERNTELSTQRKLETMQRVRSFLKKNPNDNYFRRMLIEELYFHEKFAECEVEALKYLNQKLSGEDLDFAVLVVEKLVLSKLNTDQIWAAKEIIDKYSSQFAHDPLFVLLAADVCVMLDPDLAQSLYQKFLDESYKPGWHRNDLHRLQVHPYLMLGKIAVKNGQSAKAQSYFKLADQNARASYIKDQLQNLMQKVI